MGWHLLTKMVFITRPLRVRFRFISTSEFFFTEVSSWQTETVHDYILHLLRFLFMLCWKCLKLWLHETGLELSYSLAAAAALIANTLPICWRRRSLCAHTSVTSSAFSGQFTCFSSGPKKHFNLYLTSQIHCLFFNLKAKLWSSVSSFYHSAMTLKTCHTAATYIFHIVCHFYLFIFISHAW